MRDQLLKELREALGPSGLRVRDDIPESARADWSGDPAGRALALATPRDVESVSRALEICARHGAAVVPQGGMTGLAGGANPVDDAVLLSVSALKGVEEIDAESGYMVVRAGTTLQEAQEAAAAAGMSFPLDIGARGSAQIGGVIATNAGGNRVIRYGMTRDLVLGLEVALSDGTVLDMLNRMPKNNTGYDLKQLFIGSEGTLGVITRAVLKLHPPARDAHAAVLALDGFDDALAVLKECQTRLSGRITAFELMWREFYEAAVSEGGARAPLPLGAPLYALVEMQSADPEGDRESFEAALESGLEKGWITDAAVAQSGREATAFWTLRDSVAEIISRRRPAVNFDISVPRARIGDCVARIRTRLEERFPGLPTIYFGHAGDSNLHVTCGPLPAELDAHDVEEVVYGVTREFAGSISAEHGIGTHKKPYLPLSRSTAEIEIMRRLRAALDPRGALNPGKVFDPAASG